MESKKNEINTHYRAAIEHLNKFLRVDSVEKKLLVIHLELAIKNARFRMSEYSAKYRVNMEKIELLRDVVFIGTSLIEQSSNNTKYYKMLVKACMSLVEIDTKKKFEDEFIKKMLIAKPAFQCDKGRYFQIEAFYFVFKTHFRLS
jgi:hypothetical protein